MPKISDQFFARLDQLGPGRKVRAIVMLSAGRVQRSPRKRLSYEERKKAIGAIRESSQPGLADIDSILDRFQGKRLAAIVDALGCVPIETTSEGIKALAASPHVKSILEDQRIGPIPRPKQ